jgi:hypothetical protein
MLTQVVYISAATQHFSAEALEELLGRARAILVLCVVWLAKYVAVP